jgi:cytidylate kinase
LIIVAIVTLSHLHGSQGESVAREVAHRLGFSLVTPGKVSDVIHKRYGFTYSLTGEIQQTPRDERTIRVFANLISAVLTDMAVLHDILVLGCGSQFIFRAFPNAFHVRIIAPRDTRIHNIMKDSGLDSEGALRELHEHDRRQERFLRCSFRRPSDNPDRYNLIINMAAFEVEEAVELILLSVRMKKLAAFGMVSSDTVERARLRNQIRLLRAVTKLSMDSHQPLAQFAHPSELVFARLLDFYGIRWQYEPRTFPLRYDEEGNVTEAFSPDFYLPDSDLYVELTTMKQSLVTKKNRKVKRLLELHPDIKIRLLYQKDFEDLIFKYAGKGQVKEQSDS